MANKKSKKTILDTLGESQVWKSIIRSGVPRTRRQRMHAVLGSVFLHLHPARLPKHAVKLGYTWCMGGLSFFLFVNLTITGILLMFYYRPTVEYAYTDIIDLAENKDQTSKVILITDVIDSDSFVPDPYYGDLADFEKVFNLLEKICQKIANQIESR